MASPICLTDVQLTSIMTAARQLRPRDRSKLLQLIADELRNLTDVGDGQVNTAIRTALAAMQGKRLRWSG